MSLKVDVVPANIKGVRVYMDEDAITGIQSILPVT
jgi:hypothetical protein